MVKSASLSKNNELYVSLWEQTQLGDRAAFSKLCEAHYRLLFNYALNFTADKEAIKDAIQDLFLQLWEKRATIGTINVMSIYLIRAVRNNLLYQMRKNKWQDFSTDVDSEEANIADETNVEDQWISTEIYSQNEQRVRKALELLPKRQREVLFLKFYQGLSHDEIADLMNINKQSVSNHLQKSMTTLRTLFPNHWELWVITYFIQLKMTL
ncbi:RNA polymerase sigma factor [Flectobacillus rivi]|uniref:Sigma-70 family RNA polymerase sigma factor n=1 Tax=Flectobacillus rivi TaxID=2984209 RepID=A0ABT6YZ21_9BACT|nr:sigma-70 family RNA polymerase sigma factor [Flectobacillus rivi]MDI9874088.1 sigma-70 family RNA polymerase sigma factor [Flectobacillus rivi]